MYRSSPPAPKTVKSLRDNPRFAAAMKKLNLPREKYYLNLDRYGNTSAASVPIALDEARRDGRIKPGDHIILVAFGGGLTWATNVLRM